MFTSDQPSVNDKHYKLQWPLMISLKMYIYVWDRKGPLAWVFFHFVSLKTDKHCSPLTLHVLTKHWCSTNTHLWHKIELRRGTETYYFPSNNEPDVNVCLIVWQWERARGRRHQFRMKPHVKVCWVWIVGQEVSSNWSHMRRHNIQAHYVNIIPLAESM